LPWGASPPAQTVPGFLLADRPIVSALTTPMMPATPAQADEGMRAATRARNETVQTRVYLTQEDAFGPSHEDAYPRGYWGPNMGVQHTFGTAPGPDPWTDEPGPGEPIGPSHEDAYPRGYWGPNMGVQHTFGTAPGPDPWTDEREKKVRENNTGGN
jgi:hypothetical protein